MKVNDLFEAVNLTSMKKGTGMGPQWSYRDLADKFGLSIQQLTSLRGKYPGFPEQSKDVKASKMSSNSHVYYDLKAANKWYNGVMKQVNGDIDALKKQLKEAKGTWVVKNKDGVEKRFKDDTSPEAQAWKQSSSKKPEKVKAVRYSQEWWLSSDAEILPWTKIEYGNFDTDIDKIIKDQIGVSRYDHTSESSYSTVVDDVKVAGLKVRVLAMYGPEDDMGVDSDVEEVVTFKFRRDVRNPRKLILDGFMG